jgi:hypothetical protein
MPTDQEAVHVPFADPRTRAQHRAACTARTGRRAGEPLKRRAGEDLWGTPQRNPDLPIHADALEALAVESGGIVSEAMKSIFDGPYAAGVINVTNTDKLDAAAVSPTHLMRERYGLHKQREVERRVTMCARPRVDNAVGRFGALKEAGAHQP